MSVPRSHLAIAVSLGLIVPAIIVIALGARAQTTASDTASQPASSSSSQAPADPPPTISLSVLSANTQVSGFRPGVRAYYTMTVSDNEPLKDVLVTSSQMMYSSSENRFTQCAGKTFCEEKVYIIVPSNPGPQFVTVTATDSRDQVSTKTANFDAIACSTDTDCGGGSTIWAGATFCGSEGGGLATDIMQYGVRGTCKAGGICDTSSQQLVRQKCVSGQVCAMINYNPTCVAEPPSCIFGNSITSLCTCGTQTLTSGAGYCCKNDVSGGIFQTSPGPCPAPLISSVPFTASSSSNAGASSAPPSAFMSSSSAISASVAPSSPAASGGGGSGGDGSGPSGSVSSSSTMGTGNSQHIGNIPPSQPGATPRQETPPPSPACEDAQVYLGSAREGLESEVPQVIRELRGRKASTATKMDALLSLGRTILARAEERARVRDCTGALRAVGELDEVVRRPMEALLESVDMQEESKQPSIRIVNYDRQYEEIGAQIGAVSGAKAENVADVLKAKGYQPHDLAYVKELQRGNPLLVSEYFARAAGMAGSDAIQSAARAGVSTAVIEEFLAANTELSRQVDLLKSELRSLKEEVRSGIDRIAGYTFNPALKKEVSGFLQKAPSLSAQNIQSGFEALVEKSQDLDFRTGVTPFRDIHVFGEQAWVIEPVQKALERGIMKGIQKDHFGPDLPAGVADVVTVFGRMAGVSVKAKPASALGRRMPPWAKGAAATVDEQLSVHGLTLDDVFVGSKPSDPATRQEVAFLATLLFGDVLPEANESVLATYHDLTWLPKRVKMAVTRVAAAGIMKGARGFFDPEGTFNRAQFAAVIGRLIDRTEALETEKTTAQEQSSASVTTQASSSHSSAPPELSYDLEAATEKDVEMIQKIVLEANKKHVKIDITSGLRSDIDKTLQQAKDALADTSDPNDTVNLRNWLVTEARFNLLREILLQEQQSSPK